MAIPPAWPALLGSTADWADVTVPDATGMWVPWPRGRGLGGPLRVGPAVQRHPVAQAMLAAAVAAGYHGYTIMVAR